MADWVHCNKCSVRHNPQYAQNTFFLIECGHIVCQRCVEKIRATKKCLICNKNGNILPLNKDIEPEVLNFFLPLECYIKKTAEIYKFQLQHRNSAHQILMNKYNYAKKECISCHNTNKHLMKENQMLRSMLSSSGQNPRRFLTSTPSRSSEQNLTFQNTSILSSIPPQMGVTPSRNPAVSKMYPGYPKRNHIFGSGSSQNPSPAQRVPFSKHQDLPPIHRTMHSLEELRRSGKSH